MRRKITTRPASPLHPQPDWIWEFMLESIDRNPDRPGHAAYHMACSETYDLVMED